MGTGYGPIGLALRDVGAGIGGLLEQEARRRDQQLEQQRIQGELGLRGALLANQAQQQQAQAGVQLAEVGARGRLQERQQEAETTRLGIAQAAEARAERERADLAASRQATLEETRRYHTGALGIQARQARAAELQAANQDRVTQAHAALYTQQARALREELDAAGQGVPLSQVLGAAKQEAILKFGPTVGPQVAESATALLETFSSSFLSNAPRDPTTGDILVTPRQVERHAKMVNSISALFPQKAVLTPAERETAITNFVKAMPNETLQLYAPEEIRAIAEASIDTGPLFDRRVDEIRQRISASYDAELEKYKRVQRVATVPPEVERTIRAAAEQERRAATLAAASELTSQRAPSTPSPASPEIPDRAPVPLTATPTLVPPPQSVATRGGTFIPSNAPTLRLPTLGPARTRAGDLLVHPSRPAAPQFVEPTGSAVPNAVQIPGAEVFPTGTPAFVQRVLTSRYAGQIPDGVHAWQFPGSPETYTATVQGGQVIAISVGGQ